MGSLEGGLANEAVAVLRMEFGLSGGGAFGNRNCELGGAVGELVKKAIFRSEQHQGRMRGGYANKARIS
jgi:hypothetical protein